MAVYDLEEQEQIDALKAWWKRYGGAVMAGLVLGSMLLVGMWGWSWYQQRQSAQAGALYQSLQETIGKADAKKIAAAATEITEKYPGTGYASRAALLAAKSSYEAGDVDSARTQLQWVVDRSKEPELKALAAYRLAGALADKKQYTEAVALLDRIDNAAFAALAADLKGDILAMQGRAADARAAYKLALEKADKAVGLRTFTQLKLDAMGGSQ